MKTSLAAFLFLLMPVAPLPMAFLAPAEAAATVGELGDLSPLHVIVQDTLDLANKGDSKGAAARLTDFETAWDTAQPKLRPLNPEQWGVIDAASDAALAAVRTNPQDANTIKTSLAALIAAIGNPTGTPANGAATATPTGSIPTTDANGHPIPCEEMLKSYRTALAAPAPTGVDQAKLDDFLNRGIDRCNADDDKRADDFFAQGMILLQK